jgi:hypothetical protein
MSVYRVSVPAALHYFDRPRTSRDMTEIDRNTVQKYHTAPGFSDYINSETELIIHFTYKTLQRANLPKYWCPRQLASECSESRTTRCKLNNWQNVHGMVSEVSNETILNIEVCKTLNVCDEGVTIRLTVDLALHLCVH